MARRVNKYVIPASLKQTERIGGALKLLGLNASASSFERIAQHCLDKKRTYYDFLEELLETEMLGKEGDRLERDIKQAKFPWTRTLEDFNFSYQPSINENEIKELASCRFIEKRENVVFFGPPGVGKTHLAVALGIRAIYEGHRVQFLTLDGLIELFRKADDTEKQSRLFGRLARPDLLILDEMDFYETTPTVSEFLFRLLHHRYERSSTIFTSNRAFSDWQKIFGTKTRTGAIVDRIFHHSKIIYIQGDSYRAKDKLESFRRMNGEPRAKIP